MSSNPEEFSFEDAEERIEDRPSAEDIARMLPQETREIVGDFAEHPEAAFPSFALHGLERTLEELGIITIRSMADARQEAYDRADWDRVEAIEKITAAFGQSLEEATDTAWTEIGLEVSKVCAQISPTPPLSAEELKEVEEQRADIATAFENEMQLRELFKEIGLPLPEPDES